MEYEPNASYSERLLRVQLRDPASAERTKEVETIVDINDEHTPCGMEIVGFRDSLGEKASDFPSSTAEFHALVRTGYDAEVDIATVGVDLGGYGVRVLHSVPLTGQVDLDIEGRVVCVRFAVDT